MIETVKLGDVATVKGGKRLPKGTNLITEPNSHPYIRVRDLNNKSTIELNNDFEYVDDETQKSISRYIVEAGDIVLCEEENIVLSPKMFPELEEIIP